MLPFVFSLLVTTGPAGLDTFRTQMAPPQLMRSVAYPPTMTTGPVEPAPPSDGVMRSVRYSGRSRAVPPRVGRPGAVSPRARRPRNGSHVVVIEPIVRRTVRRRSAPRRRPAYRLGAKVARQRRVLTASRLPPIWLPPPRRKIIHHSDHRLPFAPRPTPAWEPPEDQRPHTGPTRAISSQACLARLRELRVPFRLAGPRRGLVTPVVITGPVNGVKLTPMWGRRPALMDCRFALILHRIAPIIRQVGVDDLRYSGFYSYRYVSGSGRLSRHANGMAADIFEVRGPGGLRANVLKDWVKAKGRPGSCVAGVTSHKGSVLRRLACALEYSGILFQVMTPDSDYAHRNHYHLSALRVGERPLKSRYAGRRVRLRRKRRKRR